MSGGGGDQLLLLRANKQTRNILLHISPFYIFFFLFLFLLLRLFLILLVLLLIPQNPFQSSAAPVECPYAPHHVPPAGGTTPAANKRNHKQQAVREAAERREAEKCSAMNYAAALGAGLFGAPLFWNPLDEIVRVLADCPGEALILLVTELRLRFPPEDDEGKGGRSRRTADRR